MDRILVIGGGSWGTSFANYLANQKKQIRLWVREDEVYSSIKNERENKLFLPGIKISENLEPVRDLEKEIKNAEIIIFAVPSKYIRNTFEQLRQHRDKFCFGDTANKIKFTNTDTGCTLPGQFYISFATYDQPVAKIPAQQILLYGPGVPALDDVLRPGKHY